MCKNHMDAVVPSVECIVNYFLNYLFILRGGADNLFLNETKHMGPVFV